MLNITIISADENGNVKTEERILEPKNSEIYTYKFSLYQTRGVLEVCNTKKTKKQVEQFVVRFLHGDWGDVCKEDWEANDNDLKYRCGHVLGSYRLRGNTKVWINREFDALGEGHDAIVVMLPEEY